MKIGVYGGSFDPFHIGHLEAAKAFTSQCDEVWVIVCDNFAKIHSESYWTRFRKCNEMIKDTPKIRVIPYYSATDVTYTYQMMLDLEYCYPQHEFCLCFGADCIIDMDNWYKGEYLKQNYHIIAVNRNNIDLTKVKGFNHLTILSNEIPNISSTEIRKQRERDYE